MARKSTAPSASRSLFLPIIGIIVAALATKEFWWVWIPVAFTVLILWFAQQNANRFAVQTLAEIDAMDPTQFERFMTHFFRARGYVAQHTGRAGDFGADILLENNGQKTAVQAKHYTGNVGNDAVQQVLGAAAYFKCQRAMVVTNSHFTEAAQEQAFGCEPKVILIDREGLAHLLEGMKRS